MSNVKPKMWDCILTSKNYKYFALTRYIGSEQTWSCFFKSLKILEKFKKCVTFIDIKEESKKSNQLIETLLQLINELTFYYGNETLTRLCFFSMKEEYYSNIKTLLEFKGCLFNYKIPEANIIDIPFNVEFADKLISFKKSY